MAFVVFLLRNPMGEIFEAETRLMVCERPKFAKSAECNSKDELPKPKSQTRTI